MRTVAECMRSPVVTISPEASVGQAAERMNECGVGCLPVLEGQRLVGIVTSRDVRACHPNRLVADAMSAPVVTISPAASVLEAHDLLARHGIEHLVVVDGTSVVGVLTRARVEAEVARYIDPLTELPRPELVKEQAKSFLGAGRELAVVFLDLDDFGLLNKRVGHVVGDRVLKQAACILRACTDPARDLVSRYGGDEFLVITDRRLPEAIALAERLAAELSRQLRTDGLAVTVSAGVAGGRRRRARADAPAGQTLDDLVNLASLRSTEAKKRGKAVVWDEARGFRFTRRPSTRDGSPAPPPDATAPDG